MGILCPEVLCFSPREKFSHSYRMLLLLFTHSVVSDSLRPHGLQHARLPYPSPSPAAFSNLRPLNHWCHSTLSSVVPFSSCLQSFPILGSFPWVSSSYQVAKVLEFQPQYQSFQWIFRTDFLKYRKVLSNSTSIDVWILFISALPRGSRSATCDSWNVVRVTKFFIFIHLNLNLNS